MIFPCLKPLPAFRRSSSLSSEYLQPSLHDPDFEFHPYSPSFIPISQEDDLQTFPSMWSPINAHEYEIKSRTKLPTCHIHHESELLHVFPDSPPYISPLRSRNSDGICSDSFHLRRFVSDDLDMQSHCSSPKISKAKKFTFKGFMKSRKGDESRQDLQPSPFCLSSTKTCSRCNMQFRIQVLPLSSSTSSSSSSSSEETKMASQATAKNTTRSRIRTQSTTSSDSRTEPDAKFTNTSTKNIKNPMAEPEKGNISRKKQKMRQGSGVLGRARVCGSNLMPEKSLVSKKGEEEAQERRASQRENTGYGLEGREGEEKKLQHYYRLHYGQQSSPRSPELSRSRTSLPYRQYILSF